MSDGDTARDDRSNRSSDAETTPGLAKQQSAQDVPAAYWNRWLDRVLHEPLPFADAEEQPVWKEDALDEQQDEQPNSGLPTTCTS